MKKSLIILCMIFALMTSSCNLLVRLPFGSPNLIPSETFFVDETAPAGTSITAAVLTLAPSNGNLNLAGAEKGLGEGTIQYNNGKVFTAGNSDPAWAVKVDIGVGKLTLVTE
jgi:hypothetical protein